MNEQVKQKMLVAFKQLSVSGITVTDVLPTSLKKGTPTAFEIVFHRIITDTTLSQIEIKKQQAHAEGFTASFLVAWGRARFQNDCGDKTLVCPKCGKRYDWLATMLDLNDERDGLRQDLKCCCGAELNVEMIFTSAIIRYSVTVKTSPIPRGKLEQEDKTEVARRLREVLEPVIDKLPRRESGSSKRGCGRAGTLQKK